MTDNNMNNYNNNKNRLNHLNDPELSKDSDGSSNPIKGLVAAILFGIIGAILWAIVVKVTGYNIGIEAIVVGAIVSQGFVWASKGESEVR